ncbi:Uncharacterised protein [Providencia stuartii]|nr:Uncharacterised protein [Providencia stuartii]
MEKAQRISLLAKGMGMLLSFTCRLLTGVRTRWVGLPTGNDTTYLLC